MVGSVPAQSAEDSMEITPNPTLIALQVVPFMVTLLGLYVIIFKPMLAHLDGREDAIEGAKGRAAELQRQLAERAAEYEEKMNAARMEMAELRAARRTDALAEADALVSAARAEAEAEIEAAVSTVQAEAAQARGALKGQAAVLAGHIASQVLGRPVSAAAQ